MSQHHLFILDPLASLNLALDSSLRLALALSKMGHVVYACELGDLRWDSGEHHASTDACRIAFGKGGVGDARFEAPRRESLAHFSLIHMRKDPPFDIDYITATWLLESVSSKTKVHNDPRALRSLNEKLSIFQFPEATRPALVSTKSGDLFEFIKTRCEGDAVIKPLNQYGGRGVIRVQLGSKTTPTDGEALAVLAAETANGQQLRLVQAFDKAIHTGEVRAFCVGGKPLAWCLKKPAAGEFLANTRAGATLHSYQPSAVEVSRVTQVAQQLRKHGVEIVGFDVLGSFISEINLTSPRLLHGPEDKAPYYDEWADWCTRNCETSQKLV